MDFLPNSFDSKIAKDYDLLSVSEKKYWTILKYFAMRKFVTTNCSDPLSNRLLCFQIETCIDKQPYLQPMIVALDEVLKSNITETEKSFSQIIDNIFSDIFIGSEVDNNESDDPK